MKAVASIVTLVVRSRVTPPFVQGGIAQTFATIAGTRYRVTFDLAGNPNQLPRVKPMRISAAGQSAEFTFDATGKTGARMGWTPQQWTFTANATTTTLEFRRRFDLKPAATAALEGLLKLLAGYPGAPILIEGHTDSVGTAEANQVLSEQRAAAVKRWLAGRGVAETSITTRGRGETMSLASNDTAAGRQQNRRVEIRIQKK